MSVLTVNAGSSSIRLAAYAEPDGPALLRRRHETPLAEEPERVLRAFADEAGLGTPRAFAHRVVHGGARFRAPVVVDDAVERAIDELSGWAPLHNPPALAWIRAARRAFGPHALHVAVFDTAFFADLPPVASLYALPRGAQERHGIRRYGFHGLAHASMAARWRGLRPDLREGGRLVTFQLGAGASAAAIAGGKPLDTSMGFSPLEGLVMATRCGDVDPGALLHLARREGLDADGLERVLNRESGLLGLSGRSGDVRDLLAADDDASRLAVAVYCHRARKYLGAYLALLGGADGVVFGGGVGEHQPQVRAGVLAGMEWAGILLDPARNVRARGEECRISAPGSPVEAWVLPPDEEALLAGAAFDRLGAAFPSRPGASVGMGASAMDDGARWMR